MTTSIYVRNYMNLRPTKVVSATTLGELTKILADNHVSGVPVVNSNNEIIGFVSEQDCIKQLLLGSYHCDQPATVEDVMKRDVVSVKPDDSIIDLAENMGDHKAKTYPVTENVKLVGVFTRQHVLAGLEKNQQHCGAW
ncbi:MAG: putative transcriptional regulator [Pseudomonadales bacterium]|jgi:predicted transcriptional regulator